MIPPELFKKIRRIQIRTSHLVSDHFAGQYHSAFKGQGMEFQEVREYSPGDDIRAIDWNVTARAGSPYIKKYVEEREMTVMLVVDVSASHQFGTTGQFKQELAAEIAAMLAFSAISNNDRVGLLLFSHEVERYIPPGKGTGHVLRVIREVLYFKPAQPGTHIEPALTFLNQVMTRKTVCFLISDFMDEHFEHAVRITARRHDLISVIVADRRESSWPAVGVVEWVDAETGERNLLDTSNPNTRMRLAARQSERRFQLLKLFQGSGIDTIEVYTGQSYERQFVEFFRQRKRRLQI